MARLLKGRRLIHQHVGQAGDVLADAGDGLALQRVEGPPRHAAEVAGRVAITARTAQLGAPVRQRPRVLAAWVLAARSRAGGLRGMGVQQSYAHIQRLRTPRPQQRLRRWQCIR